MQASRHLTPVTQPRILEVQVILVVHVTIVTVIIRRGSESD